MSALNEKDLEAGDLQKEELKPVPSDYQNGEYDGAVHGESFEAGNTMYAKLMRIAGKFGVEQRGIERVPEDERTDNKRPLLNVATMWLSANMVVSSFAIGVLGQGIFFMGMKDSALTILFFNLIGIIPVCYFSSFGPIFGLRQMVLSRFWFGWYGVKLIAIFNVLACVGWSSVNAIVGAQLIHATNNNVNGAAGIIIIAVCTFFVCLFGYKVVHSYEFWSWIPVFIIFLITIGVFSHSGAYQDIPWTTGKTELGNVLSFGAIVYGFATGWTSYAADYTVYQPANINRYKVFLFTFIGLIIPLLFTQILGAAVMTAASANGGQNVYMDQYTESGIGGLLAQVLVPKLGGFGKFCLIVLALSIIGNNIPNIYSVSLTMQVLSRYTQRVPRFIWTFIATCVYIAIAIPGYTHFQRVLQNFMDLIGYWLAIYEGIALTEHFVFRRSTASYRPQDYDNPSALPPGIAAVVAFCFGVAGMVLGMDQVWYTGVIAKTAGTEFGGDVGFELAFAFAAVSYLGLRTLEKRHFGR